MNSEIIEVLSKCCNSDDKYIPILYLNFLNRFNYLLNIDNSEFSESLIDELKKIGKILNSLKLELSKKNKSIDEYIYSLGILSILNMNYIPENFHDFISSQDFNGIETNSVEIMFKILYERYKLIDNIYTLNGENGLTRYILINRDLKKEKNKTLFQLYSIKLISLKEIQYLTSSNYDLNYGKCFGISNKILNSKEKQLRKEINVIYL